MTLERITSYLYRLVHNPWESLRDFVSRFGNEGLNIPNFYRAIVVDPFKMGLEKDSPFYEDFIMTPCRKVNEVRSRAVRFIRLEEDMEIQERTNSPSSNDNPNRKVDSLAQRSYKSKLYSKPDLLD